MHQAPGMSRRSRSPRGERAESERSRALAEVETLAWVLDNSIRVPGTGGRRFGLDALIGLVPVVGDLLSGGIGLFVIWRASRMGLPRIVVARMLANAAIDMIVGSLPLVGDAFDLWFKANTRNLGLVRRHLEHPGASTRHEWLVVGGLVAVLVAIVALVGWLVVSILATLIGAVA